jgi:hypothetical protein
MKTDNCIIMHFPAYAGGKFIGNCLSLSKYCTLPDKNSVKHLLNAPDDYIYRLQRLIGTLPDQTSDMKRWVGTFEFGDSSMYGPAFLEWIEGKNSKLNVETAMLVDSKAKFFMTAHSLPSVVNMLMVWKDATVISLINYREFQRIAYKKKGTRDIDNANECIEKYSILKGSSWPSWEEFEQTGYNVKMLNKKYPDRILIEIEEYYPSVSEMVFDMDSCIFERDRFLNSIKQLYRDLGFNDFNEKLVSTYWNRYIALHR